MSTSQSLRLQVILGAVDKLTGPLRGMMQGSARLSGAVRDTRDKLRELEAQQKRIGAYTSATQALTDHARALGTARDKLRALRDQIIATEHPSRELNEQYKAARREVKQLERDNTRLARTQADARQQIERAGVPVGQLSTRQRELARDIEQANAALTRHGRALAAAKDRQAQWNKAMELRNRLAGTGAAMGATGGAALYAGARFAQAGIEFEESMSSVQALARLEKTSEAYKQLTAQARALGAATSFTATQAAEAQGFLAMAGFNTESILAAMPGMLDLSKAGRTELARTADIASNILTGFGLEAAAMSRLGDVMVATFTRSNVNLDMLGDTMKYVAPVAAGLGVQLETAAAMAGKLGDAGIQGSMAGTAMRAILSRLAAPPKMAADALDELKISTRDAAGNLRDLPELLAEIAARTRDLGNADRSGLLKAIAGEEAFSALQVLTDQAGSGKLQDFVRTLQGAGGEAGRTASTMADNARGDILALQSAWQDFQITLFDSNNGPLRGVLQSVTDIVRGISAWAQRNPELTATLVKVAAVGAAVVAGLGALLVLVAGFVGPLAMLKIGLGVIAPLFAAITAASVPVLAAVAAVGAAAWVLYDNWAEVKAKLGELWDSIRDIFRGGAQYVLDKLGAIKGAISFDLGGLFGGSKDAPAEPVRAPAAGARSINTTNTITVNAAPGQSERDVGAEVARQLDARERSAQARNRSRLTDVD